MFLHSIVATPGRFLHVMMEMDLKLTVVEYVVFDEADRYNIRISLENKHLYLSHLSREGGGYLD